MKRTSQKSPVTKGYVLKKILGLTIITIGMVVGAIVFLAANAGMAAFIIGGGLVLLGLLVVSSPDAWFNALYGILIG